ncbi:MAG: Type 1 glutamine amidotransferase-like domain-containing protein [Bacteriovorax sp.]|nr:Type 1 glutamine amidotransferase-like domain-containing protein [Bacteriovorax sp.]
MKLVLYSGGDEEGNRFLNLRALELTHVTSPKLTFIPSSSHDAEDDFRFFVDEFSEFGIQRFMLFCVDTPYTKTILQEVLKSDLIFLGGGNTFYFLKHLKKAGMFEHFKKFLKRGGVLCGLSAGAIVFTPHVHTASFPHFDRDDNPFDMKNLSAMRLVNFEFFPHYKNSKRYDAELLRHSKKSKRPLYACPDGGGIIVEGDQITFSGKCSQFYQGKKLVLSQYKQA